MALVKRGDDVDQLRTTEWMGVRQRSREREKRVSLLLAAKKNINSGLVCFSVLKGGLYACGSLKNIYL